MKFPTTWNDETVKRVDEHFRSKYSNVNEKRAWRDERLLQLAKQKQTYVDRDYRIVRFPLDIPAADGREKCLSTIEKTLKEIYRNVQVRGISKEEAAALDLSAAPWHLAAKNLG